MPARVCPVCGTPAAVPFRVPRARATPDLDLRPGEPARSTLGRWLSVCPGCGAVAPDLATLPAAATTVVASEAYQKLAAPVPASLPFLRWAMLCPARERREAWLHAAWAADDAHAATVAAGLRRQAAAHWGQPENAESALRLIDVLRRAGEFELARVRALALDSDALDATAARILEFQRQHIAAADTRRYRLSQAVPGLGGDEKHRGWLARLLGRRP